MNGKANWKDWIQPAALVLVFGLVIYLLFSRGPDGDPPPKDEPGDALSAIGKIAMKGGYCSGTIIGPRGSDGRYEIVSAAHCFSQVGESANFFLRGTSTPIPIVVVGIDKSADIAICKTATSVESLPWIQVAEKTPERGTEIFHAGFGVDNPGNIEKGVVVGSTSSNQVKYTLSVSPGDSGGGICVDAEGKLLSPVCCTTCLGCRGSVYGGSPERIREMLVSPASFMELEPVKMPDPPEEE